MGGHGGLNILPQKKWNVYNMENRKIVERDKRLERERQEREQQQEHKDQARERIQQLKKRQRKVSQTPSRSSQSPEEQQQQQQQSNINAELKKIQDAKKHINFFEQEEEELLKKQNTQARIELEKEFFKDKPYDMSTKFLGAYDQDKPWYAQANQSLQHSHVRQQLNQFKESKDSYYKILDLSKKYQENTLVSEIQPKVQPEPQPKANQKEEKDKNKRLQKLAHQLRELLGSEAEDSDKEKKQKQKHHEREKLRKERIQREKVERSREQKLLAQKYEFKN